MCVCACESLCIICVCECVCNYISQKFFCFQGFISFSPRWCCLTTFPSFPEGVIQSFLLSLPTVLYCLRPLCHFNSDCKTSFSNNWDESEKVGILLYFPKALCDYRAGLDRKRGVLLILLSHLKKDEVLWKIALPSHIPPFRRQEWHLNNSNQCHIIVPHWV